MNCPFKLWQQKLILHVSEFITNLQSPASFCHHFKAVGRATIGEERSRGREMIGTNDNPAAFSSQGAERRKSPQPVSTVAWSFALPRVSPSLLSQSNPQPGAWSETLGVRGSHRGYYWDKVPFGSCSVSHPSEVLLYQTSPPWLQSVNPFVYSN